MIEEITNHKDLIGFYISCGLEFQSKDFVGIPLFSYIIGSLDNIIAAITITKQGDNIVLDDLAVHKDYRNRGYGKLLLEKAIDNIKKYKKVEQIYAISKAPDFFMKYGFTPVCRKDAPDFSICFNCDQFQKSCFPVAMVYNIEVSNL